jgi:DNA-binding NarL/FixJ family response regulator
MIRVLIVDDQTDVRDALRLLLQQTGIASIVGEAARAEDVNDVLSSLSPNVILLDWELADLPGQQALDRLRAGCPQARIIALSANPEARSEAMIAGADAFVSKGDPPEFLIRALAPAASNSA